MTGAHLAYGFIVANRKLHRPSKPGKIKCVMYCGPSNKSVDVVLGRYLVCLYDLQVAIFDIINRHVLEASQYQRLTYTEDIQ